MNTTRENGWEVLWLPQIFGYEESKEFDSIVKNCIKTGNIRFIADASDLDLIHSMGIGLLVKSLKDIQKIGGELVLRNLRGDALDLFRQAELDKIFSIQDHTGSLAPKRNLQNEHKNADSRIRMDYRQHGDVGIFQLSGSMMSPKGINRLKEQILLAMADKRKFVLDMGNLVYFDSSSVGELLVIHRLLKKTGGQLRMCNISGFVKEFLDHLNLSRIIPIYGNLNDAMLAWEENTKKQN